jgi:uncharacterized damage-inducible protein DinB
MMELFAQTVLEQIKAANADLRKALDGLSGEALDWRPTGEETSSLYMLASHMVGVQRSMVALAAAKTIQRDRSAEFAATGTDTKPLLDALSRAEAEIEEWLGGITSATLSERRTMFGREVPAVTPLVYAVRHLGEHVGHAGLTRQLWDQRTQGR